MRGLGRVFEQICQQISEASSAEINIRQQRTRVESKGCSAARHTRPHPLSQLASAERPRDGIASSPGLLLAQAQQLLTSRVEHFKL